MDLTQYISENIERLPWEVRRQDGTTAGLGWVDVDVAAITQGFLLAVTNTTVEPGETAEEASRRLAELSISPIRGWDLTRNGEQVPVTVDEYLALPVPLVAAIGEAMGAVANPQQASAATSAGGSRQARRN